MVHASSQSLVRSVGEVSTVEISECTVTTMNSPTHVIVHFNSMHSFHFKKAPSGEEIKDRLFLVEKIPVNMILLRVNGIIIGDREIVATMGAAMVVTRATISGGLAGGKGGFGAMLRALAKQSGTKKTTDFGACRDLSGRRLRHVNDEKILQQWKEAKDRGDEFDPEGDTPTGIELWYLGAPSWADGVKIDHSKKFMKPRRKTKVCMDWVNARKNKKAPEGAPAHWGCPRGRRCEFAHGDEELRGAAAVSQEEQKKQAYDNAANKKRDAYTASLATQEEADSLSNMVLQGMRAQKRARVEKEDSSAKKNVPEVAVPMLPIDGMDCPEDTLVPEVQKVSSKPAAKPAAEPTAEAVAEVTQVVQDIVSAKASSLAKPKASPGWVKTLSGQLVLSREGEVESESEFATAAVCCSISRGKWYYEVELLTAGLMQIGWADHLFRTGEEGSEDGVGDDEHSWAYDGLRGKKWNKSADDYSLASLKASSGSSGASSSSSSSSSSGSKAERKGSKAAAVAAAAAGAVGSEKEEGEGDSWQVGDVVGCLLEIEDSKASISFTLNGVSLGVAFSDTSSLSATGTSSSSSSKKSEVAHFYPALSLEEGEAILLNIGQRPFSFPPAADINLVEVAIVSAVSTVDSAVIAVSGDIVEEGAGKKKAPAKKGKKTKKELAAKKEAEKEAERMAAEQLEAAATAAVAAAAAAVIKQSAASPLPYIAVIESLEPSIRRLVPIEGADAIDSVSGGDDSAVPVQSKQEGKKKEEVKSPSIDPSSVVAAAAAPVEPVVPVSYPPVPLESEEYSTLENLRVLGLLHLKAELERRSLKAGGSLEDRAVRLFSVRGLEDSQISKKLRAK